MKSCLALSAVLLISALALCQRPPADVLGKHNLTPGSGSSIYLPSGNLGCTFCHAPHSGLGGVTPLWNQTLSRASYAPYTSTTSHQTGNTQPPLGVTSSLCLSCHDGTVAVGQSAVFGKIPLTGSWLPGDSFGTNLAGSHPFSLVKPVKDASNLVASLVASGTTADPLKKVNLVNGNIECTSCHNPHVEAVDPIAQNFLVRDSSSGQMCLSCHDPNRVVQGQPNLIAGWPTSIHKTATNKIAVEAHAGSYPSVAENACTSCHMEHNAVGVSSLLRQATPATPGMDAATQSCVTCHNGGTFLSPAAPNIMVEMAKTGHPLPAGNNAHDAAEPGVLLNNRHATCVDCHAAHDSKAVSTFAPPPALRPSQSGVAGISALDGTTVVSPSVNQFENCLRCHGSGPGKKRMTLYGYSPLRLVAMPDDLNLIPEFSASAKSSHPVFHDATSSLAQPSLLANMIDLNGQPSGRTTGPRIFCTDCHNSDDNREMGKTGANGPHGSVNSHILERKYQFTQAPAPGGLVGTYPNPNLAWNGDYAMCAKCHNLTEVTTNTASWSRHNSHVVTDGFSCSVCHTSHGMGTTSPNVSGVRLVNFDVNVVASNNGLPIAYDHDKGAVNTGTCTLTCHQVVHNADGTVSSAVGPNRGKKK